MYAIALFIHLFGVAMLVGAVTTTIVATVRAQGAATVQEVRLVTAITKKIDLVIGPAMLLILGAGLFMVARGNREEGISWTAGWVDVALVIFMLMAVLGPSIEAGHAKRLLAATAQLPDGPVPPDLDRLRRNATALFVSFFGASQILAFLYLMTNKPGLFGSLIACALAAAVSVAASAGRLKQLSRRESASIEAELASGAGPAA